MQVNRESLEQPANQVREGHEVPQEPQVKPVPAVRLDHLEPPGEMEP